MNLICFVVGLFSGCVLMVGLFGSRIALSMKREHDLENEIKRLLDVLSYDYDVLRSENMINNILAHLSYKRLKRFKKRNK
jgi:hypothetical protein